MWLNRQHKGVRKDWHILRIRKIQNNFCFLSKNILLSFLILQSKLCANTACSLFWLMFSVWFSISEYYEYGHGTSDESYNNYGKYSYWLIIDPNHTLFHVSSLLSLLAFIVNCLKKQECSRHNHTTEAETIIWLFVRLQKMIWQLNKFLIIKVIFQADIPNTFWLLNNENLLIFSVLHDCKLNVFEFCTVGQTTSWSHGL